MTEARSFHPSTTSLRTGNPASSSWTKEVSKGCSRIAHDWSSVPEIRNSYMKKKAESEARQPTAPRDLSPSPETESATTS